MIIVGGLGSILGAFLGAAVLHLLPIQLRALPAALGLPIAAANVQNISTFHV